MDFKGSKKDVFATLDKVYCKPKIIVKDPSAISVMSNISGSA